MQEYLGSYVADSSGRLAFREGALVTAVRSGHWVVLDELNLAPSDVLEALNRCVCVYVCVCDLNTTAYVHCAMPLDELVGTH